mmetsp:Transcript_7258/g.20002  ORF Transcript_7258/g.20002 Transcript_7258/m.20002 type:complete len:222 (+) Transcript_7258:2356-3021(+)
MQEESSLIIEVLFVAPEELLGLLRAAPGFKLLVRRALFLDSSMLLETVNCWEPVPKSWPLSQLSRAPVKRSSAEEDEDWPASSSVSTLKETAEADLRTAPVFSIAEEALPRGVSGFEPAQEPTVPGIGRVRALTEPKRFFFTNSSSSPLGESPLVGDPDPSPLLGEAGDGPPPGAAAGAASSSSSSSAASESPAAPPQREASTSSPEALAHARARAAICRC